MAYVKPITVDDTKAWAIHGADGTALTVVRDRETAYAVVRQNEMEPVSPALTRAMPGETERRAPAGALFSWACGGIKSEAAVRHPGVG